MSRAFQCSLLLLAAMPVGACSGSIENGFDGRIPPYVTNTDRPTNVIDRALVACPDRTVEAATGCLHRALARSGISTDALCASMRGCKADATFTYRFQTHDLLGYSKSTAVAFDVKWVVTIDFRSAKRFAADLPIATAIE